ncbi:hypothetical protein B1742_26455 [Enterobacter kobei]|nr:hypothetical protein B1742_26455 [Enterobacter kobei]
MDKSYEVVINVNIKYFFCQAEVGILVPERSRVLGNMYKRQKMDAVSPFLPTFCFISLTDTTIFFQTAPC